MAMAEKSVREAPAENRRPYAATANVIGVLQRARTRNLPETIDDDFFRLVGIPDIVFGRVREALRFLGMIEDDGRPTDTLRALGAASDEEYRTLLATAIRQAYQDDFQRIDLSKDPQGVITNAFRRYAPRSQTKRMVMLLLGICREAGIPMLDTPRERAMRSANTSSKSVPQRQTKAKPRPPAGQASKAIEPMPSGLLFGVTEDDIAGLNEAEFQEVWAALGKVARARSREKATQVQGSEEIQDGEE